MSFVFYGKNNPFQKGQKKTFPVKGRFLLKWN